MTPKIKIYFVVLGNFDPNNFTEEIGLEPTRTWRVGESRGGTSLTHDEDGWEFSMGENDSFCFDDELMKMLSLLNSKKVKIVNYCDKYNLDVVFSCVVTTDENHFPSIHFDQNIMREVLSYNAEIDIDMY